MQILHGQKSLGLLIFKRFAVPLKYRHIGLYIIISNEDLLIYFMSLACTKQEILRLGLIIFIPSYSRTYSSHVFSNYSPISGKQCNTTFTVKNKYNYRIPKI